MKEIKKKKSIDNGRNEEKNEDPGSHRYFFSFQKIKKSRAIFKRFPRFLAGMQKVTKKRRESFDFINVSAICRRFWVGKGNSRWKYLVRIKNISDIVNTHWQNECPPFRVKNQKHEPLNDRYFSVSDSKFFLNILQEKKN